LGDVNFLSAAEFGRKSWFEVLGRVFDPLVNLLLYGDPFASPVSTCKSDSLIVYYPSTIISEAPNMNYMMQIGLHELGHVAHLKILGRSYFNRDVGPRWVQEGFADKIALDILEDNGYGHVGSKDYSHYERFMKFLDGRGIDDYSGIKGFLRESDKEWVDGWK